MLEKIKLRAASVGTAVASALALVGSHVHAAVPATVTTALGDMQDDALEVAGLVLIAIIAVAAFKFMRKGF